MSLKNIDQFLKRRAPKNNQRFRHPHNSRQLVTVSNKDIVLVRKYTNRLKCMDPSITYKEWNKHITINSSPIDFPTVRKNKSNENITLSKEIIRKPKITRINIDLYKDNTITPESKSTTLKPLDEFPTEIVFTKNNLSVFSNILLDKQILAHDSNKVRYKNKDIFTHIVDLQLVRVLDSLSIYNYNELNKDIKINREYFTINLYNKGAKIYSHYYGRDTSFITARYRNNTLVIQYEDRVEVYC